MHILFTLLSFYGGGDIMFEDIYQPLEPKLVAMTASQDIYILDSASAQGTSLQ